MLVNSHTHTHTHRAYDNDRTSDIFRANSSHDQPNVILGGQIVRRKRAAATDETCPPKASYLSSKITWPYFIGSEEPLLKLLRSTELQHANSSSISNCQRSKSAIFSRNINYNINSLLRLHVGTYIILIYSMYTVRVYLHINDNKNKYTNNNYCPCILQNVR